MNPAAYILPSLHIDKIKWDACVQNNSNGLIYSSYDYLHNMADQWHGIVIDDYRAVMAIPWRMKLGIRYAYMPAFTQQLGLAGNYTSQDMEAVFRTLPDFVSFADIHFNFTNTETVSVKQASPKTNFIIDLVKGYDAIHFGYSSNLKENIKKHASGLVYTENTLPLAISLCQDLYRVQIRDLTTKIFDNFYTLCQLLEKQDQCFVRTVTDNHTKVLAIALLLRDKKRIYNIMNAITPEGRKKKANDVLLDSVIHEFSGQSLLFDFEGSELPGVKAFYEKFGADNQPYFYYRYNGLPWFLRLCKR